MAAHTSLKSRKEGQGTEEELQNRNLRDELDDKEKKHYSNKDGEYRRQAGQVILESSRTELEDNPQIDEDSDDDNDDDEEALLAELKRLREEKEQQRKEGELERKKKQEEELKAKQEHLLVGNPLMLSDPTNFSVKRRWDDDVVFKKQDQGETKTRKRFINDTIRSDFHRNFLHRFMK